MAPFPVKETERHAVAPEGAPPASELEGDNLRLHTSPFFGLPDGEGERLPPLAWDSSLDQDELPARPTDSAPDNALGITVLLGSSWKSPPFPRFDADWKSRGDNPVAAAGILKETVSEASNETKPDETCEDNSNKVQGR